jgi:hypothetical protein
VGKWKTCCWFSTFPRVAGAVEMWKSRPRFPRAVGNEENLPLVFLVVHQTGISTALCFSCAPALVKASEQLSLGGLHLFGGLGVAFAFEPVGSELRWSPRPPD